MNGDDVSACLYKVVDVADRIIDHQMHVKDQLAVGTERTDDGRTEADVGHKGAVHYVQMHHIGTAAGDLHRSNRSNDLFHIHASVTHIVTNPSAVSAGNRTCLLRMSRGMHMCISEGMTACFVNINAILHGNSSVQYTVILLKYVPYNI